MKKISMLLCVFLFGTVGMTAFGGTVGVPVAKIKVVQPRVVQRSVVMPDCACNPLVDVDPTRIARVTTVFPRTVQRGVVTPTCGCEPLVDTGTPRLARVKVVQPRVVQRGVVAPACGCLTESPNVMP